LSAIASRSDASADRAKLFELRLASQRSLRSMMIPTRCFARCPSTDTQGTPSDVEGCCRCV